MAGTTASRRRGDRPERSREPGQGRAAGDRLSHARAEPRGHGHAVAGVAEGVVGVVEPAGMRHLVHGERDLPAPGVCDRHVRQLGEHFDHSAAEDLGAARDGVGVKAARPPNTIRPSLERRK